MCVYNCWNKIIIQYLSSTIMYRKMLIIILVIRVIQIYNNIFSISKDANQFYLYMPHPHLSEKIFLISSVHIEVDLVTQK